MSPDARSIAQSYIEERPRAVSRFRRAVLRRLALSESAASFEVRGFRADDAARQRHLEAIGAAFIRGYNWALVEEDQAALVALIHDVEPRLAGFVAEGAAMGCAIGDTLSFRPWRLRAWLDRAGSQFTYLIHVGAGWAIARVPWRRRAIVGLLDPVHQWLVYDGLGFSDAFFRSRAVLGGWKRLEKGYACRAYDQGVGRALWFIFGADSCAAADWIGAASETRRADLWSGLGLAAVYAGGADPSGLEDLPERAAGMRSHLAQGAAFAVEAYARAGQIPEPSCEALHALTGQGATEIVATVRRERAALDSMPEGAVPKYELWRLAVQRCLSGSRA